MALAGIFSEAAALRPVSRIAKIALTNGAQSFEAELTLVEGRKDAVLLFEDGCPARDQEFWVCAVEEIADASQVDAGNVVSFQTHRNATRKALVLTPQMAASAAE
ncbi:hypothetical protein SAMN05444404_0903 [Ruegeria lacuscaerulensis ITI-1157]|nr:hypothetical protein SAMN05444404_0903 [Ruegeria lacuscaerulensis ITI-1157]